MRINDAQSRSWTVEAVGRTPEVERLAEAEAARGGAEAVKVTLSERAKELSAQRPSSPPPADGVDLAKVERLRAQIADGSFAVDPDLIASRMLDEA